MVCSPFVQPMKAEELIKLKYHKNAEGA